jgi:D-xylose 1-dehydrogenase (NADP+, D-xylono-1,5-lactone-forming)
MNSHLKFGLIGFGRHAELKMLPTFEATKSCELTAIGTSSSDKAKLNSEKFSKYSWHPNYEEVIKREDIDAIFIVLPNHLHYQWAIRALEAGKHVLCEKPLCLNAIEATHLSHCAKQNNKILAEVFAPPFHPQHQLVKRRLKEGVIGQPRLLEVHFHFTMEDKSNIRFNKEYGGGGLYDAGCYLIRMSRFFFDQEPVSVNGTWKIGKDSNVDEVAIFQLHFANGEVANCTSGINFGWGNTYTIYGDTGRITVPQAFIIPWNKKGVIEIEKHWEKPQQEFVTETNHYKLMLESFCSAIRENTLEGNLLEDGLKNMTVLSAVMKSCTNETKTILE